jgi:hypothetical protein
VQISKVQRASEVILDEGVVRYVWNLTCGPSPDVTLPSGASTSHKIHIHLTLLQALGDEAKAKQVKVYCNRRAPICYVALTDFTPP